MLYHPLLISGRAIYLLTQTLPDFFSTGLIDSSTKLETNAGVVPTFDGDVDSIYSPKVRLSYTPPMALPSPFPQTLHIEGKKSKSLCKVTRLIAMSGLP